MSQKNKVVSNQARQGDLFFERKSKIPTDVQKTTNNILAYGEVTGHSHRVVNFDEVDMSVDKEGHIWISSEKPITIDHDEHGTITLDAGTYCMTHQREYDANAREQERRVAD